MLFLPLLSFKVCLTPCTPPLRRRIPSLTEYLLSPITPSSTDLQCDGKVPVITPCSVVLYKMEVGIYSFKIWTDGRLTNLTSSQLTLSRSYHLIKNDFIFLTKRHLMSPLISLQFGIIILSTLISSCLFLGFIKFPSWFDWWERNSYLPVDINMLIGWKINKYLLGRSHTFAPKYKKYELIVKQFSLFWCVSLGQLKQVQM